jgi:hypothetical protein
MYAIDGCTAKKRKTEHSEKKTSLQQMSLQCRNENIIRASSSDQSTSDEEKEYGPAITVTVILHQRTDPHGAGGAPRLSCRDDEGTGWGRNFLSSRKKRFPGHPAGSQVQGTKT